MPCRPVHETNGTVWWRVSKDSGRNAKGATLRSFDEIQVQWNALGRGGVLFIDQGQDRIELSLGQAYDIIDALNRAVGKPAPTMNGKPI